VTLVARNANDAMVAPMVGSAGVCVWLDSGPDGRLNDIAFGRNLASVAVKMLPHLIYLIKELCTFLRSTRFANNAAINYITVQHKKVSLPSTLTGHTLVHVKH
jgi:hypothetical protein